MICALITEITPDKVKAMNEDVKAINEYDELCIITKTQLCEKLLQLYCEGYDEFYTNCEYGIPLWAAEFISELKKTNTVRLNIVIPYEEQCSKWEEKLRDRYYSVHSAADSICFASNNYEADCYKAADEIMMDKSDLLIIFTEESNYIHAGKYAYPDNKRVRHIYLPLCMTTK